MSIEGKGASRGGADGMHNEDAFLVEEGLGLYVVCDGASESPAGEVASRIARDAVSASIERSEGEVDVRHPRVARFAVEKAMKAAARAVSAAEETEPDLRGLSTTVTMLLAHGDIGVIGHRGDSRAYLLRGGRSFQLTIDHELTDSVDHEGRVPADFDVFALRFEPRDTVVLCTDGAEAVIEDPAIAKRAPGLSPGLLASRIVSVASRNNPDADATAVVVRLRGSQEPGWLALSHPPKRSAFGHTLGPRQRAAD